MRLGRWYHCIGLQGPFIPGYRMKLDERSYGVLSLRNLAAEEDAQERQPILPGDGFLVLEAPKHLYAALRSFIEMLAPRAGSLRFSAEAMTIPIDALSLERTRMPSAAKLALQAPYRVASPIHMEDLVDLCSAQAHAARSQMQLLMEDPAYFHDEIARVLDHHYGWVKNEKGKTLSALEDLYYGNTRLWGALLGQLLIPLLERLEMWTALTSLLSELLVIMAKSKAAPGDKALRSKALSSFMLPNFMISKFMSRSVYRLNYGAACMGAEGLRDLVYRLPVPEVTLDQNDPNIRRDSLRLSKDQFALRLRRTTLRARSF
jgi:hypothetical protein